MSIRHVILGFLSWRPHSGYELKKLLASLPFLPWSGNNNQVYGSLLELHRSGAVGAEVLQQEKFPAKKLYRLTSQGEGELHAWLTEAWDLPERRNLAQARLAWAEGLEEEELENALARYVEDLRGQVLMARERAGRRGEEPARSARESLIWTAIGRSHGDFLAAELAWAEGLLEDLRRLALEQGNKKESLPLD